MQRSLWAPPETTLVFSCRLENAIGTSNKFYEIYQVNDLIIRAWGRIGDFGQTKTNQFASSETAERVMSDYAKEKSGRGYTTTDPRFCFEIPEHFYKEMLAGFEAGITSDPTWKMIHIARDLHPQLRAASRAAGQLR